MPTFDQIREMLNLERLAGERGACFGNFQTPRCHEEPRSYIPPDDLKNIKEPDKPLMMNYTHYKDPKTGEIVYKLKDTKKE